VSKADPRMAHVLHEHPWLDRRGRWRISETEAVYILTASSWLKRLLVVLDKETLKIQHVATANRFFGGWMAVDSARYDSGCQQ
jgi:hypothetical protein